MLLKRCYVSMYNADQNLVQNFTIPKSRGTAEFSILFQHFAWNEQTLAAEAFLELNKQVYNTAIHDRLAELGARTITVMTFQNNDNNHSAASALNRVIAVSKTDGFKSVVRGECNPRLAEKAREMMEAEKKPESAEFDEKTKAVLLMSLENMATKEGLSHLEEKSDGIQSSVDDMKETIIKDYQGTIASQKVTIDRMHESMMINDRKTMELEKKNETQSSMIAKLNADKAKSDRDIAKLNADLNSEKDNAAKSIAKLNAEKDHANRVIAELKDQIILQLGMQKNHLSYDQMRGLFDEYCTGMKRKHCDGDGKE